MLVTKWKNVIYPDDKMLFNKWLQDISTSIIELANIDESSHEETIVNFITETHKKTKNCCLTEDDDGNCFEFSYSDIHEYNSHTIFVLSWRVRYSYINDKQI